MTKCKLPIKDLLQLYSSGLSCQNIVDKYDTGVSRFTISHLIEKSGLIKRDAHSRCRKYTLNETFFENIDTEEKSYWLGFLYADGCVSKSRTSEQKVQLKIVDKEHLYKFHADLNSTYPIREHYNLRHGKKYPYWYLNMTSTKMVNDLISKGCSYRKTHTLVFPDFISKELISHFMRGYFDGDGCVSTFLINNKRRLQTKTITSGICGTENFCIGFKRSLPFTDNNLVNIHPKKNIMSFTMYAKESLKFYKFIYKNATIFLERKKQKFDNFILERGSETIISHPKGMKV